MRKIVLMAVILTMISSSGVFAETTVSHERRTHVAESQSDVKKAPVKENKAADKKMVENGSATDKVAVESNSVTKENGQSNVTATAKEDNEKKNIYHGVSVYTTRNDTEEKYNAALLDAKRNAVEQAGTYIEVHTDMKNFEITTDEVKVLSAAVVRLVPNSIKKQVVSNVNGVMEIRVEADFEIDMSLLMDKLPSKRKDLNLSIHKYADGRVNLSSQYSRLRENIHEANDGIHFSVTYYNNWQKKRHNFFFYAYRHLEGDSPVVFTEEYPLLIDFTPKPGVKNEKHTYCITPEHVNRYSCGTTSTSIDFSWDSVQYIANWGLYNVVIKYYEKDGTLKELPIPEKVLVQWREMIVAPKGLVENN